MSASSNEVEMQTISLADEDNDEREGESEEEDDENSDTGSSASSSTSSSPPPRGRSLKSKRLSEPPRSNTFVWSNLNDRYHFSDDASILTVAETMFVTPEVVDSVFVRKIISSAEEHFEEDTRYSSLIQYHLVWNYMVTQWNTLVLAHADDDLEDDDEVRTRELVDDEAQIIEEVLRLVCIAVSTPRCIAKLRPTSTNPPREVYLSSVGRDPNDVGEATFLCHIIRNLGYGFAYAYRRDQCKLVLPKYVQMKHIGKITESEMVRAQREKDYAQERMEAYYSEYFSMLETDQQDGARRSGTVEDRLSVVYLDDVEERETFQEEFNRKAKTILSTSIPAGRRIRRQRNDGVCNFPTCNVS